jgi:autotransporter-associated beta strand protein
MNRAVLLILALAAAGTPSRAQTFFKSSSEYITPAWRGTSGEFSWWDVLYSPLQNAANPNGFNYPDMAAPNGVGGTASSAGFTPPANASPGNPFAFWHAANPTLAQTGAANAFIIGPGTAGNIYSFSLPTAYALSDSTTYNLGTVNIQWQTEGALLNFGSVKLVAGGVEYLPSNFITEYKGSASAFGFGFTNRGSMQWDLTGLGITNYTIVFSARGSSNSFQEFQLDTAPAYTEATPSTRTWTGTTGNWSVTGNWGGALPSDRGNIRINSGSGLVLDGTSREVSELVLNAPNAFAISATGGATLQINTGITAKPATPQDYTISAPVEFGSLNLIEVGDGTSVTLSGSVGGDAGFYRFGSGTLNLTGSNNFAGQAVIDGGRTVFSSAGTYTGGTVIFSGALHVKGNAGLTSGTLGANSSSISLGSGGTFGEVEAALIIDGPFTVAKPFALTTGEDPKKLGGINTGTGATFSGSVSLTDTTGGVFLHAENATDKVTFSGAITGGGTSYVLTKSGAGTVVFSAPGAKSYLNRTEVAAGILDIASGATLSGTGTVHVQGGAKLLVHGAISGGIASQLLVDGGMLGGNGTITRTLSILNHGTLAPGDGVGSLTVLSGIFDLDGRYQFQLNDADLGEGTGWDFLQVNGALSITATVTQKFTIELGTLTAAGAPGLLQDFVATNPYTWRIATATGGITGFDASRFVLDASGFLNPTTGSFSVSQSGNDLFLNYVPVPEPNAASILILGAACVATWRSRRVFNDDRFQP